MVLSKICCSGEIKGMSVHTMHTPNALLSCRVALKHPLAPRFLRYCLCYSTIKERKIMLLF